MLFSRLLYYLSSIPTLFLGIRNWHTMLAVFLGIPVSAPIIIALRNGERFHVRTPMDIWVIKETCLDRQYEKASVPIQDGWHVIDIGAGLGDFSIHAARAADCTVYAYEPFPESFAFLQENLQLNRITNVRPFAIAIGGANGTLTLRAVSAEAVQQTTVSDNASANDAITVPSITLDQALEQLDIPQFDYIKMDCEGAEYEILFNASPAAIQKIRHICLEYHDGVTRYSHDDLTRFFEMNGFEVTRIPNPAHRVWGLMYARKK